MKIEIKSLFGSLLFEYECENNNKIKTLEKAVEQGADLLCADLRGAYLRGADLRGAYLRGAYLRGADLRGADLLCADLRGADLRGAYLRGADLRGADLLCADLRGADLRGAKYGDITIKKAELFTGIYKYVCMPILSEDNKKYIRLGCYCLTIEEWESNFWNNESEFPNNNSYESNCRKLAYETCKKWFELIIE